METFPRLIVGLMLTAVLSILFVPRLAAQNYRVLAEDEGEVRVFDYVGRYRHSYEAARSTDGLISFPTAVLSNVSPGEIVAGYIRTSNASRSVELIRSLDGGRTWLPEVADDRWDREVGRSLSLFNLGRPDASVRIGLGLRRKRDAQNLNSLMMFSGGSPIVVSSSYTNGEHWSRFNPTGEFGGFRVSSVIRLGSGRIMALFHDDGRFLFPEDDAPDLRKSVIYKMYSSDGGLTWSDPEVALKHNLYGLYDAVVIRSPARRDNDLILIAGQRGTGTACIAFSSDDGDSWSYPVALSHRLHGDRFAIGTLKRKLFVAFRDLCCMLENGQPNPTFGDLVLWTGDRRDLARGGRSGVKVRLADNYPVVGAIDHSDLKFSDLGYISLLPMKRNEIVVITSGRWDTEELPSVRAIIFDPSELRREVKNQ